jgi:hypothetical protein
MKTKLSGRANSRPLDAVVSPHGWQERKSTNGKPYWVRVCTCGGDMDNPCFLCRNNYDFERHTPPETWTEDGQN